MAVDAKPVTASELRQNVYRLLDEVLETGEPLEIERKGKRLKIVPGGPGAAPPRSKFERMPVNPDLIVGDPDDLDDIDWSAYWKPDV